MNDREFIAEWKGYTNSSGFYDPQEMAGLFTQALDRLEARLGNYDKAFEGCRALVELGEPVPVEKYEAAILAMMDLKEECDTRKEGMVALRKHIFENILKVLGVTIIAWIPFYVVSFAHEIYLENKTQNQTISDQGVSIIDLQKALEEEKLKPPRIVSKPVTQSPVTVLTSNTIINSNSPTLNPDEIKKNKEITRYPYEWE